MARIPDEQIERLKAEVPLVRLVEAKGVELKRHGKDYHGRCPFHDDRTPSLVVSPESNLWHCLGACQVGGSVLDWVMKAEGVSFRHAVELLRNDYLPLAAGSEAKPIKQTTVPKLAAPLTSEADDQAALSQVIGFYHDTLKQDAEALAYLDSRGLCDPELIQHFRLGYANRTLAYRLPQKNRKTGAELRGQLQRVGILRASGHEHFNGSVVIPVINEIGQITEVYGRKIRDDLRPGTPSHLYLPGAHAGVFNAAALPACSEIILCEALIDALTFWRHGFRNVTCSYGVEGFTPDHLAAFQAHGIQRVLIAYDRDAAGDRAAVALAEKLTAEGIECWRVQFPKGMDANEYALKVQPAAKGLALVLRKAEWLGNGKAPERQIDLEELIAEQALPSLAADNPVSPAETLPEITPALSLPASPCPTMTPPDIPAEVTDTDISLSFGDRRYRVRGLAKNTSVEHLKINVLVHRGEAFHVDSLDLYSARQRGVYIKQAANELGLKEDVLKADLGKLLLKLETLQEQKLKEALAPKASAVSVSEAERAEALALLHSPQLLERILADFATCGVVGEETNKLVGYLACVSRKLQKPLAVIIQSSSAAGKSSLMDAVLALMPEEERVQYSAMTGQSLFYMGETNLQHKILAIAEEEGAERASYALKLLQSDGALTMASTGKDPLTGNLVTQEYRVEGPVMIFLTTTAIEIDEELLNRCLVLTVNESREQTQAIHAQQRARRTLAGLTASIEKDQLLAMHRNAQRLLRPLAVINPFADRLTFLDTKTRTRRDHEKYLTLIDSIALLHQYQRPVRSIQHNGKALDYIEVTLADIAQANRLAHDVLGRSLDELPPQTRRLLDHLHAFVGEECQRLELTRGDYRFSRRVIRERMGWTYEQLRVHLERLIALEYVLVHRGGRGQSFEYELLYDGQGRNGEAFLLGLVDTTTGTLGGEDGEFGVSLAGHGGAIGASLGSGKNAKIPEKTSLFPALAAAHAENALLPAQKTNGQSYPQATV